MLISCEKKLHLKQKVITVFRLISAGSQISAASNKHRTFGYPHWNKHLSLISASLPLPFPGAYYNSYHISLVAKPRCIGSWYANNKMMTILLIFRFFHYIWFIDSKDFRFILILKEKMRRLWHFMLFISLNFEISAYL